jgi:aryl-alcohol dehydrogenase-like predicted oxidoreductase
LKKNKLILGTVQMGLNYGVNNIIGRNSEKVCHEILLNAYLSGIRTLDTAEAYGVAHHIIGKFHKNYPLNRFSIITKLPHEINKNSIETRVKEYLNELGVENIDVLMFHTFQSFEKNYSAIKLLEVLKEKGLVKNIGVSVYENFELRKLIDEDFVSVIQLPYNLFDNFSIRGELMQKLKSKGKIIHTRSAFLQGLFFKNRKDNNEIVRKLNKELLIIDNIANNCTITIEELALNYCIQEENVDNVIIGVDSIEQLRSNLKATNTLLKSEILNEINEIKVDDLALLNPSLWK